MHTDRSSVVRALRSRGEHDRAIQAACALPRWVDTERDAGLLLSLDVDVAALERQPSIGTRDRYSGEAAGAG